MIKSLKLASLLVATTISSLAHAEDTAQGWNYECATLDKDILLGALEEVLTYGHLSDMGTANYAVTVYRADLDGNSYVRAVGYTKVPRPGCYRLLISNAKLETFIADLVRLGGISVSDQLMLLKQMDGGVDVIALRQSDGSADYYDGSHLGPRLLELAGAAKLFLRASN